MVRYSVAMGIRVVCLVVCLLVPGWWALAPAIGAIVLPYFAVLVANNVRTEPVAHVRRPGSVQTRSARTPE